MFITETGQLPSVGGGDDDGDKERDVEEEKLRQEAIKKAEEERRVKHRKMEEEREHLRQNIRDKVGSRQPRTRASFTKLRLHYDTTDMSQTSKVATKTLLVFLMWFTAF